MAADAKAREVTLRLEMVARIAPNGTYPIELADNERIVTASWSPGSVVLTIETTKEQS